MFIDETLDICRYEVGIIINDNRRTIIATNDLKIANTYYKDAIENLNNNNHVIIFVYDYDKNVNINYFDSEVDIC